MNDTATQVAAIRRVEPGAEATALATAMYDRIITELEALDPAAWDAVTVCAPWTVADVVRHLVGAAEGHASFREQMRQIWHGRRHRGDHDGNELDAMNALQVADHAALGPAALVAALRVAAPQAVAGRARLPKLLHRIPLPNAPGGSTAEGMPSRLTLGQLYTVILTRDVLMHRIDIATATGRALAVDEVERRLVEDVVAEWASRHGEPFELRLSGPAGGRYAQGEGGPVIELDAVELCWILSGRGASEQPLLGVRVLF